MAWMSLRRLPQSSTIGQFLTCLGSCIHSLACLQPRVALCLWAHWSSKWSSMMPIVTFLGIGVNDGVPFTAPSLAWSLAVALQMSPSYVGSRPITTEFVLARYSRQSRHSARVWIFISNLSNTCSVDKWLTKTYMSLLLMPSYCKMECVHK